MVCLVMPVRLLCCLVGLLWSAVAVALDEPLGVVGPDEAGHGLAELVDGVVQLDPQALVLQRAGSSVRRSRWSPARPGTPDCR